MRPEVAEKTPPVAHRTGVPYAWALVTVLLAVGSAIQKLPCLRGGADTDALATAQCYSDIPLFYVGRGLAAEIGWLGQLPPGFRDLEYPPLINLYIEASAKLTHVVLGTPPDELASRARLEEAQLYDLPGMATEELVFFLVSCAGLLIASLAAVWIAWRAGWVMGDRVTWLLITPIVVLTLTLNWDALALLATAAALFAWQRHRMAWFGAFVALGTAAKLFPLVLLAAGLILAIRARSSRAVVAMTTSFVVVTLAANLPLHLSDADAWGEFWTTNTERQASFGSVWMAARMVGLPTSADQLSLVLAVGMLVAWLVCAAATWTGRLDATLSELSMVFLVAFFALGKVYSPQYSLWVVLGLLLVTRSRWLVAVIAAAETFHYVATWLYIRGFTTPEVGVDKTYWFSVVLRLAAEVLLALVVLRRARRRALHAEAPEPGTVTAVP